MKVNLSIGGWMGGREGRKETYLPSSPEDLAIDCVREGGREEGTEGGRERTSPVAQRTSP